MMAKTEAAFAAQQIRKVLKQNFKGTKFGVRSNTYSGGSAVYIEWEDGPTRQEVERKVNKYQYGTFDGMCDCYDADNNRNDIPQVKFVQCQRRTTAA